jgi:hypothetical protein
MLSAGKSPDLSTKGHWQTYQQSLLVPTQEELGEGSDEFDLAKYLLSHF